uniref:Uncharacterized protein n=1 Tax=Candidatus Kentrum sp. MB TaxID=2138164 RepID=A0A451BDU6_9GAMM|nr:MAG: hypothetical protein BECKMB1821G_GA0114241_10546 [Candidatus Kentron sp. MB]VFK34201.1 MAG: hypothetical protein BECKMB1821I_GA0114274_10647 [Candidatus Kentron sp. MB]VFK76457.1 MAG: hypothetical protein BECKMB1821H_GA0114242_105715 [Candidatus Kentron sp. MB]
MNVPMNHEAGLSATNNPLLHPFLTPFFLSGFVGALLVGVTVALPVEAFDYGYTGARQGQSWDRQDGADYATRWDRKTKPWSRTPSNTNQSGFDRWGSKSPMGYDKQGTANSVTQRNWQREQGRSYTDSSWRAGNERDNKWRRAPDYDEYQAGIGQKTGPWAPAGGKRNPRAETGAWSQSDPWTKSQQPSGYRNDQWKGGSSWSQGGHAFDNEPRWRNWSRLPTTESSNPRSSAPRNRWSGDPARGSESHTPITDPTRHQKDWRYNNNWGHGGVNSVGKGRDSHRNPDHVWGKQPSRLMNSTQGVPPADVMWPDYSTPPGYTTGYPEYYYPPYSVWGGGSYPEYHQGWRGVPYGSGAPYGMDRSFPMFDDLSWFFF